METTGEEVSGSVDVSALQRFLAERLPGDDAPIQVEKHLAGYSNETFYVTRGEQRWVLRRPPRGSLLPASHDVLREYRVLSGLYGTPARVPRPLVACEDPGIIGTPFYLMERVNGIVVREKLPPALDTPLERARIREELVDALVELHGVDWRARGLESLGKPQGYLERQLRRWSGQIDLTLPQTRPLPALHQVTQWLRHNLPESGPATVVHGDYKLDNVMLSAESPVSLVAIFDWEMATIGDPLADLGWMLSYWDETGLPTGSGKALVSEITQPEAALAREAVTARYEEKTGRRAENLQFYVVLAVWKLAIILEGLYALLLQGTASNPNIANAELAVPELVNRAHRLIARRTY